MKEDQAADDNSSVGDEDYFDADAQPQTAGGQLGADGDTSGQSSDDVFLKLAQDGPRIGDADGRLERKSVSLGAISSTGLAILSRSIDARGNAH